MLTIIIVIKIDDGMKSTTNSNVEDGQMSVFGFLCSDILIFNKQLTKASLISTFLYISLDNFPLEIQEHFFSLKKIYKLTNISLLSKMSQTFFVS